MFLPSLQLENESFVLKDISIAFKNHFMLDSSVLIHHIHSAVPLLFMLFMLFESEIVSISLR